MGDSRFDRLTIRTALVLGFGLTLGLWFFAGYQFTRRISEVHEAVAEISARYMRAQEELSTVRTQILLTSVLVRDALLDPDPSALPQYRARLDLAYQSAEDALARYSRAPDASADESDRIELLRTEIARRRSTTLDVLAGDRSRGVSEARSVLSSRITPRREIIIRISEELQALNRNAFMQQQRDITATYREVQARVWRQLGMALLGSLGIGLLAILHAGRLERRLRVQRDRNIRNAKELQRLSAEIVRVQEDERRSIARELHDEVGQVLTAIKVELASAQRGIEAAGGPTAILEGARGIADSALHTVRDLSHLLHPALLDDLGLPAAAEKCLVEFGRRHAIRTDLQEDGLVSRLSPDVELAAYRAIQEALTNVARHASAQTCRVTLQRLPTTIRVAIEDDGVGFDPQTTPAGGLGLIGIRERVTNLEGSMRVDSAPGRGTRLTILLPVGTERAEGSVGAPLGEVRLGERFA